MSTYNGFLASYTGLSTNIVFVATATAVPAKMFSDVRFGLVATQGVSGKFFVDVIGAIGGATFVIAGRSNVTGVGSFPMPLILYGQSGTEVPTGVPRPYGVNFSPTGTTWAVGITASVYMTGRY